MTFRWVCLGGRLAKKREEERAPQCVAQDSPFFLFLPLFLPPTYVVYVGLCVSVSVSYNVAALRSQRQGQFRKKREERKQPHPQKITSKQRQCLFSPNSSGKKSKAFLLSNIIVYVK